MNRINGFLQIKEYELIRSCTHEEDGKYCIAWIILENQETLFKAYSKKSTCINELFWSYVLNYLKIENVGYDLANIGGLDGVITKSFKNNDTEYYSIREIIQKYRNQLSCEDRWRSVESLYNVQDLKKIFQTLFKNYDKEVIEKLDHNLLINFIIQILSGNSDLHSKNIGTIIKDYPIFSPSFDLAAYGDINLDGFWQSPFILQYQRSHIDETPKKLTQSFLETASEKDLEIFREYIEKIRSIPLACLFEEMEENIHTKVSNTLKKNLSKKLTRNAIISEKMLKRL